MQRRGNRRKRNLTSEQQGELFVVVPILLGLMVAAINAFTPTLERARLTEMFSTARQLMLHLAEYHAVQGGWPPDGAPAVFDLLQPNGIEIDRIQHNAGNFNLVFNPPAGDGPAYNLSFRLAEPERAGTLVWLCGYAMPANAIKTNIPNITNVPPRALPAACRAGRG